MVEPSFFTPIRYSSYKNIGQEALEMADSYFNWGNRKVCLVNPENDTGVLVDEKVSTMSKVWKFLSCLTVVVPIGVLIAKAIFRSKHHFRIVRPNEPQAEGVKEKITVTKTQARTALEAGIVLPEDINQQLSNVFDVIKSKGNDPRIRWISQTNNLIFSLTSLPSVVFKLHRDFTGLEFRTGGGKDLEVMTEERYKRSVRAKRICMTDQIALAVIPSTKLVEFQHKAHKYVVIAEEKFDINKTGSEEKEILLKQPKEFEKTIRAVVALIVKLNLSDIAPRNLPTIEPTQPGQPRRIVMIDLEEASGCAIGLWGEDENRPGLLGCVPESLVDVVFDEARKQGVQISAEEEERLRRRRLEELAKERSLEEFHTEHHIVTGSEHLDVKPEELGLDLNEKTVVDCPTDDWKAMKRIEITMKEVVEKVVKMINDIIDEKSTEKASIKAKRYFLIGTSYKQFPQRFIEAGLPPGNWIISAQEEKEAWLYRVVSALAEKKYIHSFRYDGVGRFWIQA